MEVYLIMAVKIRLKRMGSKKSPFYRIVVADSRSPRDGRFIETVGTYNPLKDPAEVVLKEDLVLEEVEADKEVSIKIDWEKLYNNMVTVEAHWLYNLQGWEDILPADQRKEIIKAYKKSKTIVKEAKIGRNDSCPCGSGKKYKKCCGK